MSTSVRRGNVFWANLDPTIGVEIKKTRPVIVVSNDVINERSRLVIVVPLTTNVAHLSPSHVLIPAGEGGLVRIPKCLQSKFGPWTNGDWPARSARYQNASCGWLSRQSAIHWICDEHFLPSLVLQPQLL